LIFFEPEAQLAANEIKAKGGQAMAVRCDVTQLEQIQDAVLAVTDAWGQVDILVNNAGWDKIEPFIESQPETWRKSLPST
jgi:2-hydroxycyclohexanecarboxyl-CoA dehydrogenase